MRKRSRDIPDSLYGGCSTRIGLFRSWLFFEKNLSFLFKNENRTRCIYGRCVEPDSTFWHWNLVRKQDCNKQTYLSIITAVLTMTALSKNVISIKRETERERSTYKTGNKVQFRFLLFLIWFSSTKSLCRTNAPVSYRIGQNPLQQTLGDRFYIPSCLYILCHLWGLLGIIQ